jgi:hypothetical protein
MPRLKHQHGAGALEMRLQSTIPIQVARLAAELEALVQPTRHQCAATAYMRNIEEGPRRRQSCSKMSCVQSRRVLAVLEQVTLIRQILMVVITKMMGRSRMVQRPAVLVALELELLVTRSIRRRV